MLKEQHSPQNACMTKKLSWTAVMAGALASIGLSFLLNIFSLAIGLSLIKTSPEGVTSLAVGGFLGLLIGAVVTMYMSGFVAGYLGKPYCSNNKMGVLYGFMSWCAGLVLLALLALPLGHYLAVYMDFVMNPSIANLAHIDDATIPAITHSKTTSLAVGAFMVFVLFYVGAFSACVGGYRGMCTACGEKGEECR